jgi:hypothetical protein
MIFILELRTFGQKVLGRQLGEQTSAGRIPFISGALDVLRV